MNISSLNPFDSYLDENGNLVVTPEIVEKQEITSEEERIVRETFTSLKCMYMVLGELIKRVELTTDTDKYEMVIYFREDEDALEGYCYLEFNLNFEIVKVTYGTEVLNPWDAEEYSEEFIEETIGYDVFCSISSIVVKFIKDMFDKFKFDIQTIIMGSKANGNGKYLRQDNNSWIMFVNIEG